MFFKILLVVARADNEHLFALHNVSCPFFCEYARRHAGTSVQVNTELEENLLSGNIDIRCSIHTLR